MKIGISLINYTGSSEENRERLRIMFKTLFESDIMDYDFNFSILENGSDMNGFRLIHELLNKYEKQLGENQTIVYNQSYKSLGIVFARNCTIYRLLAIEPFDYLLELHNDMVFPKVWFKPLIDFLEKNEDYAIVSPNIINNDIVKFTEVKDEHFKNAKVTGPTTFIANHPDLIRMSALEEVGIYDEKLLFQNWEEVQLWYRLDKAGYKTGMIPDSIVYHEKAATRLPLYDEVEEYGGTDMANLKINLLLYGDDFKDWYVDYLAEEDRIRKLVCR
jgi:GT2 family glycosyltransferase